MTYGATDAPSAVLIRPDGTIGSALASGGDEIRVLVGRLTAERAGRSPGRRATTAVPVES